MLSNAYLQHTYAVWPLIYTPGSLHPKEADLEAVCLQSKTKLHVTLPSALSYLDAQTQVVVVEFLSKARSRIKYPSRSRNFYSLTSVPWFSTSTEAVQAL